MPRDLPIGNGQLLINFDAEYRIRDVYYPFVGKENHAGGHVFRFGVMVNQKFRWVGKQEGWEIQLGYEADTLLTQVRLHHKELGVTLHLQDCVDFHESLMVPGDLGESGFEDWPGSTADWLPRARAELDQLDWRPMGAGFWLRLAHDGRTTGT